MNEQVERIELMKERLATDALGKPSEFKGCKFKSVPNIYL